LTDDELPKGQRLNARGNCFVSDETRANEGGPAIPKPEAAALDAADPSVVTTTTDEVALAGSALCLSGGGSRAMLFHAGAILRLAEIGLLEQLECVSSVSGGSITAGLLARCWAQQGGPPSEAVIRESLITPLLGLSARFIDIPAFIRGTLLPGNSPGRQFAADLDRYLYSGFTLGELPDRPEFVVNATNLGTGVLWRFSRSFVGDYQIGGGPRPKLRISTAVAASSAFPPFFAPLTLRFPAGTAWPVGAHLKVGNLPSYRSEVQLGDGGIYDNLGLETAWKRFATVYVSNGGGSFHEAPDPPIDPIRMMLRVTETIDHQVRSLRLRNLIGGYRAKPPLRQGAYWGIRTAFDEYPTRGPFDASLERTLELANIPTQMRGLAAGIARRLVNWGYAGCDAAVRSYAGQGPLPQATLPFEANGI
jgi:NTE family protein